MRVCVVGAGPCGLTTIKQLLDEGHEVVCFDKNPDVGGIWLRGEGDEGKAKAFDNLHLTISIKLMAYSDYPFQGKERLIYSRGEYFEYLRKYADHFGLNDHIRFDSEVTDIRRESDGWTVSVRHDGVESDEKFGAVAICSGPFRTPNRAIPGLEHFTGEVVHSAEYRNNERFRGKRVLIVGLAESGADIVREIGDVAETCTLSIRSYTYLLPRVYNRNQTTDHGTVRAHHHEICGRSSSYPLVPESFWGRSAAAKTLFRIMSVIYGFAGVALGAFRLLRSKMFDRWRPVLSDINPLGEPADPAKIDIGTLDNAENWDMIRTWNRRSHPDGSWAQRGIFCKNVSFIPGIVSGRIALNDSGIGKFDGNTVHFRDTTVGEFDTVVLCTGYTQDFSIGDLDVKEENVRNLYKHFLHPEH